MNELDKVKVANYKAGATEAYGVVSQTIQKFADGAKSVNVEQLMLSLEAGRHLHFAQIVQASIALDAPKNGTKKRKPAKKKATKRKAAKKPLEVVTK